MNSPPKRRGSSNAPGINAGALRSALPIPTKPSRRPSFQSPTRSSLAKSNPGVLEHAISRSPSRQPEPQQSKGEKEALNPIGLRGRKAFRPSISGTSSPLKAPPGNAPLLSPSRRASGVQSFTKPPRRLSKKIVPGDFFFGSPIRKQPQPAEQDLSNTPEGQLATELGSATRETATESHIYTGLDGATDDNYDNDLEPELPPTPTQLGLEKAPDRSIGLLSSSPSGRYEKRMKRKATDTFQKSPLKTLKFQSHDPEEISDSDTGSVGEDLSAAALEKRKLRKSLKAELRYLKDDVAELMEWTGKMESDINLKGGSKELDHFLSLLSEESSYINRPVPKRAPVPISSLLSTLLPFSKNVSRPTRPTSPLPTNPFALKDSSQSPSYLAVFAPLALHANTSRSTLSKTSAVLETHTLTFTPPPPFPSSLYNIAVVYETDPESQCVISVSVPTGIDSKKRRVPEVLRRWIDARLASSLLKLDVATLCWGINRYWEASVARARLWARIDHKYGSVVRKTKLSESRTGVITISELRRLIPHLDRSSLVVKSKSPAGYPQVLLSNPLSIDDWTGEPQLRPELSVSTSSSSGLPSKKIDQEAKKLFHALLREDKSTTQSIAEGVHFGAVVRATEGTLGALFGHD
ncbi:hypothetical protein N7466_005186 [Penicillium verhagenii]|uniref:uncharacterized protein n=1 Tax=Penicillium verhagenii TaxID=1562060 RepID=UPI002544E70A|nr:uncharacterized protein N7466_005186 [Penicillium verhagenii]KAJ5935639.1 hypothetical protein N7466_005186 [Penicillium verhagenii]